MSTMMWNVYIHDMSVGEIKPYNVFTHSSFSKEIDELLKEYMSYDEFSAKLKSIAQYYFWSKAEYEIVVTSWIPHISNEELDRLNSDRDCRKGHLYYVNLDVENKVDVYDQLHLNWEHFVEYVWRCHKCQVKQSEEKIYEEC